MTMVELPWILPCALIGSLGGFSQLDGGSGKTFLRAFKIFFNELDFAVQSGYFRFGLEDIKNTSDRLRCLCKCQMEISV